MSMSFRGFCYWAAALVVGVSSLRAQEGAFDFEVLRARAKELAAKPYVARSTKVPPQLMKLTFQQHQQIKFDPKQSWWSKEKLPFPLQFFHPGFLFDKTVDLYELRGGQAQRIPFLRKFFTYGAEGKEVHGVDSKDLETVDYGDIPNDMGFSGFRILSNLSRFEGEIAAFQGASYFRMLCMKSVYGLSARGLAVRPGDSVLGEEFPRFEEFWIQRPASRDKQLVIYALLDSPSIAGAYRFEITPGAVTVAQIKAVLFARTEIPALGVAPLTSMFWHGESSSSTEGDYRPEVHDSDGLMMSRGNGERLWRPLSNPGIRIRTAAFSDENPQGFGLLQRDRNFEHYQDLQVAYQSRPSAWVEPIGKWGKGSVRLLELNTADETNDNIGAYWVPDSLPPIGQPIEFEYKLHWFMDQIKPPVAEVIATRMGASRTHDLDVQHFWIDYDSPFLRKLPIGSGMEAVVEVPEGVKLAYWGAQKNPYNNTWRLSFGIRTDGSKKPVELRCFLRKDEVVLSEKWTYLWQP